MEKRIDMMGTAMTLLPDRALLLPDHGTLVVADWHLGKASHFRKAGIFMPAPPVSGELARLQALLHRHEVTTVVFLGDLFHSDYNSEWLAFERFRLDNAGIRFILTRGNHDVLPEGLLTRAGLDVEGAHFITPHIRCAHHPSEKVPADQLLIAGHVHPGCLIPAKGRQSYRLPCFYLHAQTLLLPAFGLLTGLHLMRPVSGATIYPVAGNRVFEWKKTIPAV